MTTRDQIIKEVKAVASRSGFHISLRGHHNLISNVASTSFPKWLTEAHTKDMRVVCVKHKKETLYFCIGGKWLSGIFKGSSMIGVDFVRGSAMGCVISNVKFGQGLINNCGIINSSISKAFVKECFIVGSKVFDSKVRESKTSLVSTVNVEFIDSTIRQGVHDKARLLGCVTDGGYFGLGCKVSKSTIEGGYFKGEKLLDTTFIRGTIDESVEVIKGCKLLKGVVSYRDIKEDETIIDESKKMNRK